MTEIPSDPAPEPRLLEVSGTVWLDASRDGVLDGGETEGVEGAVVLMQCDNYPARWNVTTVGRPT